MSSVSQVSPPNKLFVASFIALIATAFSFMLRIMLMGEWEQEFQLTKTQAGTIFGAGLWPFGISIVLFSLVLDRVGYRKAMAFAFVCHILFALMTILAGQMGTPEGSYQMLKWGSIIGALGNGTVEAVINPLIATLFSKEKTKWLNILHAGWPGGLVLTGVVMLLLPADLDWQIKIGLIFIPTLIYGVLMLRARFPVSERVAAGVGHREMLAEVGWGGAFIVALMIVMELSNSIPVLAFLSNGWAQTGVALGIAGIYGMYARSFGRPMFVFLLVVMLLLATTELGTDSWIKDLMGPAMATTFGLDAGWVLVYTATIMMVLRFTCGPIVEALKPLGVLAASSLAVTIGIYWLSVVGGDAESSALIIFIAATIYGVGQTFFWPTTLGFVSEQFPRGGAMTLNVIAGVGMLGVGVLGNVWLGTVQDTAVTTTLQEESPEVYERYVSEPKQSVFGAHVGLDTDKLATATPEDLAIIEPAQVEGKMDALRKVTVLPILMLLSYLGLIFWFRSRGGYKPVDVQA